MKHIINIKTSDEFNDLKDSLNRPNVILLKEENKLTVNSFETYKNNYVPDYKIKLMINISDTL